MVAKRAYNKCRHVGVSTREPVWTLPQDTSTRMLVRWCQQGGASTLATATGCQYDGTIRWTLLHDTCLMVHYEGAVRWRQYEGAVTRVPVRWCSTRVPVLWCQYEGASTMGTVQGCQYGMPARVPVRGCQYFGANRRVPARGC